MPKPINDALAIAWLEWLRYRAVLYVLTFILLLWPLAMLFLVRHIFPEDVAVGPRLIAGSIVFVLGLNSVNNTANTLVFWRFSYRLKLLISSPVHPASFAAGFLTVPVIHALLTASAVLLFAPLFGISIQLSPWFVPAALLTACSMVGLALVIGTWAPTRILGGQISQIACILLVMVSPIYYPVSRLPDWLQPVAQLSPFTHAANVFDDVLSGKGGFYGELTILAAITVVGLTLGLAGMRWRET
jgi:ABC-type multidrug transport system permease subunit